MTSAISALIRPPRLKSMCRGATLARSYAGETKLATTLIPTVATAKVIAPSSKTTTLSMCPTTSTGSVMYSPYTANVPAVTSTDTTEKAMKLTGRPQKLPTTTARRSGANRAKSQKLSSNVEKYATTRATAAKKACTAPNCGALLDRFSDMFQSALAR